MSDLAIILGTTAGAFLIVSGLTYVYARKQRGPPLTQDQKEHRNMMEELFTGGIDSDNSDKGAGRGKKSSKQKPKYKKHNKSHKKR